MRGVVCVVAQDGTHRFSKVRVPEIHLIAGLGVDGDAHLGQTVQHRSRVVADPTQPNLRQVHLQKGLLKAVVETWDDGTLVRKAGVMSIVRTGGVVRDGDDILVDLPPPPHRPLDRV